ncbi:unnamed protein product [Penicillium salamii]|nr:unnamed protein product [Penicillium salamii]CAG8105386.1 unnamed protein product [Penicillium salamii]CAG8406622.1 unnamed protein product [Penicillium salamii]
MVEIRKRHCWECLRRRLVCDFALPGCNRCKSSGVDCPGYSETPPVRVRWLEPGRVKSRQRKSPAKHRDQACRPKSDSVSSNSSDDTQIINTIRPDLRPDLKTEVHALIDAFEYYNDCMYPRLAQTQRLGTNTNIYKIPVELFRAGLASPNHIRLGLVCMTISHRMNQMGHNADSKALQSNFFHYRGLLIRSLNNEIGVPHKRNSDVVLAGILTLLFADAQQGIAKHWRHHIEGARRLINLRGGILQLIKSPGVLPIALCFVFLIVNADTSSPASDLLVETLPLQQLYSIIDQFGGNGYAFQMCPPPLFLDIIKINHIRSRASKVDTTQDDTLQKEASQILSQVYGFPGEEWASANDKHDDENLLLISIFQSAVALYCMSSLQSVGVLPPDPRLKSNRYMETRILYELLNKALNPLPSAGSNGYFLWPLVVLGVQAIGACGNLRTFVRENLVNLSASSGTHGPLAACQVLETFWASGKTEWDDCFRESTMLTTILTVNRGQLLK